MKLKLNILDWVVIGVLALVILFAGYQIFFTEQSFFGGQTTETMVYQVEFRRKTPEFRDAIMARDEGDIVYISANERDEAEVLEVLAIPATSIEFDRVNGRFINSFIPDHYDVTITVRSEVTVTDREFRNGSTGIRIGAPTVVRGLGFAAEGFIIDMWIYGEERDFEIFEEFEEYQDEEHIPNGENQNGEGGDE